MKTKTSKTLASMKRSLILAAALLCSLGLHAAVPDRLAVRAIIGEGANQSDAAMLGIACAIRNRGTLHGVYGLNGAVTQHASSTIWSRAERAWRQAKAGVDVAAGCKFFGCPTDAPYFLHTLHFEPVKTIGQITFYRPPTQQHFVELACSTLAR